MKKHLKKILGKTNIVGVIASDLDILLAHSNPDMADVYEWRVDCIQNDLVKFGVAKLKKPIILTVRDEKEGGSQPWMLNTRAGLYRKYAKLATFMDIEASNVVDMSDVIFSSRRRFGTGLIVSRHFRDGMPTFSAIEEALHICQKIGGDTLKIVAKPQSYGELIKFLAYVEKLHRRNSTPIAVMAMGTFGKISRLMAEMNSSPLIYGYVGAAAVPGQLQVSKLRDLLADIRD